MNLLNVPHLHLLLNHVPTVGTVAGLGLFLLSLVRKNDHLQRASFEVFFIVALLTLPTYLTGVVAYASIDGRPGVKATAVEAHHDAALVAFLVMQFTGAAAWLGLWQFRRFSRPSRATLSTFVLLAVVTMTLMARAANIGGEIRHPEILSASQTATATDGAAAPGGGWLGSASLSAFVVDHPWIWPTAENLHFIGLCVLFGVLLVVNLRILGAMKAVPFSAFHRLLPWGMLGFAVNLATGMLFFIAHSDQYTTNVAFYWKVVLMLVAGADFLLTVVEKIWTLDTGRDASIVDKAIAVLAIGVWAAVIYCGRMMPFLGNAA